MRILMSNAVRSHSLVFGRAAALLAGALAIAPVSVLAAARVSGDPQAVRIEAQNTSIGEILSALGHEFNVHYSSSANLEKQLSGTYQGSLQRVLTRVLQGYNFIVRTKDGRIEVTVLGTRNASGTAEAAATPALSKGAPVASQPSPIASKAAPIPQAKPGLPAPSAKVAELPEPILPMVASSSGGVVPEIKLAEEPMPAPMPTLTPSSAVPPMPTSTAGPIPELVPSNVAPPVQPLPGAAAMDAPKPPMPALLAPSNGTNAAKSVPAPTPTSTSAPMPMPMPTPTLTSAPTLTPMPTPTPH